VIDLRLGDCLSVMRMMPDGCVDAIVTDPPYGLKFMGREWDHGVPGIPFWSAMLRVLKPGGYLLAFGGTRTFHRQVCAIEDAGFQVRDCLMWLYGQGFPKAKSCLKPGWEPIILAWKPSRNVPPLNIDECRIGWDESSLEKDTQRRQKARTDITGNSWGKATGGQVPGGFVGNPDSPSGRWPANLVLTCCGEEPHAEDCPVAELDRQSGILKSGGKAGKSYQYSDDTSVTAYSDGLNGRTSTLIADSGGASRFFYCSKALRADRDEGNTHPTVKSTELMRWLCRLITPAGGMILDPFMGSGSTLKAAIMEGFGAIGIEFDEGYFRIAQARIAAMIAQTPLFQAQ
jgi:DNA modification methylase